MRILHVLNHCRRGHGNAHVAVDLACEQARQGETVGYASEGGDLSDTLTAHGVELFDLDQTRNRYARAPQIVAGLCKIIDRFKPDVVHAHMMTAAATGFVATRIKGKPLVTHIHNSFDRHSILMGLGDRIIAVSQSVADQCIRRRMSRRKMRVVTNGTIGTARLTADPPPPEQLVHPNIGTLCGLHPRKGVDHLINGFDSLSQRLPGVHLYIVGDGPFRQVYEQQAAASPAGDRIHFVGGVDDPRPYLSSMDVFALASLADPCPLVIGEARHAGCAVVGTNVDGIPETLDGGKAGRLVPPADPSALADALHDVLATPASLAAAQQAARQNLDQFSVRRVVHDVDVIYRELVRKAPAAASLQAAQ